MTWVCRLEPDAIGEMPRFTPDSGDVHDEIEAETASGRIAEGDHLPEFPQRVDVEQGEGWPARREGLQRDVQQHARILADRIEHDGVAEFGGDFAQDEDRFGLELSQMSVKRHWPRVP